MENGHPRARSEWIIEVVLAVPGVVGLVYSLIQLVIWGNAMDENHMAPVGIMGALMIGGISAGFVAPLAISLFKQMQSRAER